MSTWLSCDSLHQSVKVRVLRWRTVPRNLPSPVVAPGTPGARTRNCLQHSRRPIVVIERRTVPFEQDGHKQTSPTSHIVSRRRCDVMPKVKNPYTGRIITVTSLVKVSPPGSPRQRAYCARSAGIRGDWKKNPSSKNLVQRRRWKCPYVPGELRLPGDE